MPRRKKHHDDEHIDESWLIPYADLLTLLLALFIVLFAMSSIDAQKFQLMSRAFNSTFTGGTGVLEYPSPVPDGEMEQLDKEEKKSAESTEKQKLKQVEEKVNAYIKEKNLQSKLKAVLTDEGLLITIHDDILFDSGSAVIKNKDRNLPNEISKLLVSDPPRNIIVSGHTDNIPIRNSLYESNWELSVMRAVEFMKVLLENKQLDPKAFSAKGFGEYKPVASNNSKAGRQKNRRVEILILPIEAKTKIK
ncbi:flagellar motor protein MotB [Metabacillus sp. GX 13764]|uniref:flagellar motor protein MotB n=1 Tax=Metabacillus kandeliae TaxID=2900151 RepID=UPI001E4F932A|nr:flagellar motor protein MotB [Metabacillus kandeliae]MCD7036154.1 flagellar motor protein MotB [Metabacillus kandeliae]